MISPIKRILVPLDPSVFADAAVESACKIAKWHDAEISGVAVLDSKEIRSSIVPAMGPYYPLMVEAVQAKLEHADHILEECVARFAQTCEKSGVRHSETEYEGVPAEKLLESSIFFDLVVTGLETSFHFETRKGEKGECLSKILERAITPILAVPPEGLQSLNCALIAFDGSLPSARALHDFIYLTASHECAVKLTVAEMEKEKAEFLLRSASELLRVHGKTEIETINSDLPIDVAVSDDLLQKVDLIVAGVHSKKFWKDLFVGSFTKEMLERGSKPMLLSH